MRLFIFLFISFSLSLNVDAQTGSISGKVFDKTTEEPISYATIVLKSNGKVINGGISNDKGVFSILNISIGIYEVEIQFIGYKSTKKNITISKDNLEINLGSILLEEDTVSLESVEITAERSTIEQKIDRKVINIGKDLATVGASAGDIMGNIPSVTVNQDGEISLRGNENVRILIDGKLTNIDATQLLQQIPSTSIAKIELITNPSAKYNPEGMSGIINLVLKKNTNSGFNGTLNFGDQVAQRNRFNSSLSLNYRANKINIYGSYGNRFGEQITDGTVTRLVDNTNQLTTNINDRTSHLLKVGFDYYLDTKNTISVYTNQNSYNAVFDGEKKVTFFNDITQNFAQDDLLTRDNYTQTYNIDFKHDFNDKGHTIELELDYNHFKSEINNDFDFSGNNPITNYDELVNDRRVNSIINLDYTNPLNKNSKLELGSEVRFRRTENDYTTNNSLLNNSDFYYDRDIVSLYTTWGQNLSKWSYQLGVRIEDYQVNASFKEDSNDAENFENTIFSIFPSGFLKYSPNEDEKNSYQLSFSRRIDRPSLNQINPIRQTSTPQIIIVGNQGLNPQFTNSIELNYTRRLTKGSLTTGVFYRRIKDEINRIGYFDDLDPNLLVLDYANFDSNNAYGFELNASYRPTSWWNFNASFDLYTRNQKGVIQDENVVVDNTLMNFKINNSFKVNKVLTFQLFGFYSGRQKILQYELKENYYVNTGARYNFANGNATFSINFNDVLGTQRFAFEAYRTIIQEGRFLRDTQSVFFGLSYRFGSSKNSALKRKKRDNGVKADRFL